ncbi:UPF0057-domain-containing protein [Calocera viscosa TUFC12733]|uniref:UPF0057-domain-containing protein n=1 Tax=Calocera viscosa (strain TUFC12733) TaxID=1330018 RepID=A0A167KA74_CALVF|nr:UPF0057-domain-containing protein [Calocera viscosa TUFC12733]
MARPVSSTSDVLLYFIAIFLPPVAVFLKRGFAMDFWINILLCCLAWIPGIIHAWWIITKHERPAAGAAGYGNYGATGRTTI